jgi:hypothetical protein
VTRQAGGPRRLAMARTTRVRATDDGTPLTVDGQPVAHVRESWLVEDRWWTKQPLRRRYWELVSEAGRDIVVYHDLASGRWLRQR